MSKKVKFRRFSAESGYFYLRKFTNKSKEEETCEDVRERSGLQMSWSRDIPVPKGAVPIPGRDGEYIDPRTLSTTPGGTIYGTTPGGTRIVYNRDALLNLQRSPMSRTPPSGLPVIPGVTAPKDAPPPASQKEEDDKKEEKAPGDEEMFEME